MKRSSFLLVALAMTSSTAQHLRGQETAGKPARTEKGGTQTDSGAPAQPSQNDSDYKIGPQDVVRVDVWKEPDISRVVPVRPDGKITLPFLNDVQAAGLAPAELASAIREGLKKYITNPQVTVTLTEINSRRVYITGEVAKPGAYPLLPNMTVLQGISSCGGFTEFANTKKIYILRTEDNKQIKIPVNYKSLVSGHKPEENILLKPGDTIVVP